MRLGLEHNGQRFEMEIVKSDINPPSDHFTGVRKINKILLYKWAFDQFIMHLQQDDFEAIRNIFERLVDLGTKELPYSSGLTKVYVTSGEPDPLLKKLIG